MDDGPNQNKFNRKSATLAEINLKEGFTIDTDLQILGEHFGGIGDNR